MMRILTLLGIMACFAGGPVMAQSVDFGDDSGDWSNDGECDDPRFEGPGMTSTVLLDEDIRRDATDCKKAFNAGMLSLRDDYAAEMTVASVNYGNDDSGWANNDECDDRRFVGKTMTSILNNEDIGRDATDCRNGVEAGVLSLWVNETAMAATQCETIDFGDDSGEFANDDECDDGRFEGLGMASSVGQEHIGSDASDCSRFCDAGVIAIRKY